MDNVKEQLGMKYFAALYLTQSLCLRITQVLRLKAEDFDFKTGKVWVGPFKRKAGTWKPLLQRVCNTVAGWRLQSKKKKKKKKQKQSYDFTFPERGFLFPSRTGSKLPMMTKDVFAHAIKT